MMTSSLCSLSCAQLHNKLMIFKDYMILITYMKLAIYHTADKFGGGNLGEFGKSSLIHQIRVIQICTHN